MSSLLVFNRVYTGDSVSHVGIFDLSCKLATLYLLSSSTPPPLVNKYTGLHSIQCVTGGGGGGGLSYVIQCDSGVIRCVFDQIPNLQNYFATPNKSLGRG
jgi:hypothetical protein